MKKIEKLKLGIMEKLLVWLTKKVMKDRSYMYCCDIDMGNVHLSDRPLIYGTYMESCTVNLKDKNIKIRKKKLKKRKWEYGKM